MRTETGRRVCLPRRGSRPVAWAALCLWVLTPLLVLAEGGAGSGLSKVSPPWTNPPATTLNVRAYAVQGDPLLTNRLFTAGLDRWVGTNVSMAAIVEAAAELQHSYYTGGYTNVNITVGQAQSTNGLVILHVFRGALPQIVIDGRRILAIPTEAFAQAATNASTSAQASAHTPGMKKVASTNAAPGFRVAAYEIHGDTLLTTKALTDVLVPYTGTNVTVADIMKAGTGLQMEYRNRGFPTVKVAIPPQRLDTNGIVKIQVVEGRLAEINVFNNHHFSSNNIMRALPSLHTNMILLEPVFQAELDRANANQDRQIYPEIGPGPVEGTSTLDLKVKDRLPLHAKVEFNNQSSPGTPDLRINTSAVYNNLWQHEHSLGVQYAFSPQDFKTGNQWNFYDLPEVANYGAFYRLPLANPEPIDQAIAARPGNFGYNEATRKFLLPPPSGTPELNLYASRSTTDTGLMTLLSTNLYDTGTNSLSRRDVQQDVTVNETLGFRLSMPVFSANNFQSGVTFGPDYKHYELTSQKTNIFTLTSVIIDTLSGSSVPTTNITRQTTYSPVPTTTSSLNYLPLSLRYNASYHDPLGVTGFGLGLSVNSWYSGSKSDLQAITGSHDSTGYWVILNPTLSRDFTFGKNWTLSLNASGQWADEPLISNEQFGIGGVGSVRGYHEGEVFGNDGWWTTAEQKTPSYVIGKAYGNSLLSVRGSVYMGYGQAFSQGPHQDLWGAGFGGAASVGPNWEARLLFSWPFISTPYTKAGQPRFDFALSAQF